jgi:hypothetical protein
MKKLAVAILLSFAVIAGSSFVPDFPAVAYAQKKEDKGERKNPPGPPKVRDKGPKGGDKQPKEPPPRRKPGE